MYWATERQCDVLVSAPRDSSRPGIKQIKHIFDIFILNASKDTNISQGIKTPFLSYFLFPTVPSCSSPFLFFSFLWSSISRSLALFSVHTPKPDHRRGCCSVREVVVGIHTPRGAQACQLSSPTSGASHWASSLPPALLLLHHHHSLESTEHKCTPWQENVHARGLKRLICTHKHILKRHACTERHMHAYPYLYESDTRPRGTHIKL